MKYVLTSVLYLLTAVLLALAILWAVPRATAATIPLTIEAATPEQVAAVENKIKDLTARLDAMGDVHGDVAAIRAEMVEIADDVAGLRDHVEALTGTVGDLTKSAAENAADILNVEAELSAIEKRLADLESRLPPGPDPPERTDNERQVLAFVAPFLPLGEPGADVALCGIVWACAADLKNNPQYAGQPFVYESLKRADEACRNPSCLGIAILPGLHKIAEISRGQNSSGKTIYQRYLRYAPRIRALDKTVPTAFDCRESWGSGGDFCVFNQADAVLTIEGVDCIADSRSQNSACYGATSKRDSRLVLMDLAVSGIDNCVRTTGRWVMLFRVDLIGCARTPVAHGIYASGDWRRKAYCPMLVMIDVWSTGNELAHAAKSKCAVNLFRGGVYEARNGVCIEVPQGGATLIENVRCEKPSGNRYHAIAYGSENAFTDGSPRTDKKRTDADLCPWMTRETVTNPILDDIAMGRLTIRGLHVVNKRKAKDGRQLGTALWANPYIKADGNEVCRPPHEITGLTTEGGPVQMIGNWREL